MTEETSAAFPAPPHNFRLFQGRTERLLGWNESGREVYARTPFSGGEGAPEITTRELMPCPPGWYALLFNDAAEADDLDQDVAEGSGWRFQKLPILGWSAETSSRVYATHDPASKPYISRSMKPIIPDLTADFELGEFENHVSAYLVPDGRVYSYAECGGMEAISFESWCNQMMQGLKKKS